MRVSAPLCVWFRVCVCVAPSLCVRAHDMRACACLCAQHALCEHSMVQTTCRGGDVGGDGHGMRPAPGDGQQLPAERRIKRALPLAAPLADALPSTMPGGQRARPHCAPLLRQYAAADPPLRRPAVARCVLQACARVAALFVADRSTGCAQTIVRRGSGGLFLVVRCSVCATIAACLCVCRVLSQIGCPQKIVRHGLMICIVYVLLWVVYLGGGIAY